ncbi:ankyrin repeat-containing domain protein [Aspergillus egyptiacus]|nr:ankyrin repeat-containing domain protein [Aspergillus egyptiacus]
MNLSDYFQLQKVESGFIWACYNDKPQVICLFLPRIRQAAQTNPALGYEALYWACRSSCTDAIRSLVQDGHPFHPSQENRPEGIDLAQTPLQAAMTKTNPSALQLLVQTGADLDSVLATSPAANYFTGADGVSLLHIAAYEGYPAAAEILLSRGYNINQRDATGETPLLCAASYGHTSLVSLFQTHGADVNTQNNWGQSALLMASFHDDPDLLSTLLHAGADPNLPDSTGSTPLLRSSIVNAHRNVSLLLDHGANINHRNSQGRSALSLAAGSNRHRIVQLLIDSGADINQVCINQRTPFSYAAERKANKAAAILVRAGCDTARADCRGKTPLEYHRACRFSGPDPELVSLAVEAEDTLVLDFGDGEEDDSSDSDVDDFGYWVHESPAAYSG